MFTLHLVYMCDVVYCLQLNTVETVDDHPNGLILYYDMYRLRQESLDSTLIVYIRHSLIDRVIEQLLHAVDMLTKYVQEKDVMF